jgi:hypothetical protein
LNLGGVVTVDSALFLKVLFSKGLLDKFETRYFMCDLAITLRNLQNCLIYGQKLELAILRNRQNIYYRESQKESDRINIIAKRVGEID